MMIPYIRGIDSHQAHVDIPDGTFEEEYARARGFLLPFRAASWATELEQTDYWKSWSKQ